MIFRDSLPAHGPGACRMLAAAQAVYKNFTLSAFFRAALFKKHDRSWQNVQAISSHQIFNLLKK